MKFTNFLLGFLCFSFLYLRFADAGWEENGECVKNAFMDLFNLYNQILGNKVSYYTPMNISDGGVLEKWATDTLTTFHTQFQQTDRAYLSYWTPEAEASLGQLMNSVVECYSNIAIVQNIVSLLGSPGTSVQRTVDGQFNTYK